MHPKWQDIIFSVGQVIFGLGLLPSLLGPDKPSPITSMSTGLMLLAFLPIYVSYKLWATLALTAATAGVWFTLFFQSILS